MPSALLVMNNPRDWPLKMRGVEIVPARAYLAESRFSELRGVRVFNLCRSYRYQSIGYYVSLLAAARGHRPLAADAPTWVRSLPRLAPRRPDGRPAPQMPPCP